jgi:putative lumazine-binding protein
MERDDIDDIRALEAVIARQFRSLNWAPGRSGDWQAFAADFFPGALLYPAARPAKPQTVEAFIERMRSVAETTLQSFEEAVPGTDIRIFGNVAIAASGCAMIENSADVNRGVEMLLLVKSGGSWQIVAQAWDTETPAKPIPADLAAAAR